MNLADIAVIVPVYNRCRSVLEALDSVAAQTLLPHRLIVVDDGSTDGSADAVQRWLDRAAPPFSTELILQENAGVSAARNRAIRQADCPYYAFLDSDDVWPADFLDRTHAELRSYPQAVAATCDRGFVDANDASECRESLELIAEDATKWLFLHDAGIASASLFRADELRRLGGFREHLRTGGDLDLFFRLSLRGPWRHARGACVTFRRGVAKSRGEAGNISLHYPDKFRRIARIYDDLVRYQGDKDVLPRPLCARVCSTYWYRAGRELLRAGRAAEARTCFQRSTNWRFWNKAWFRVAQSYVGRAG